ncbi:salicylate synthase [Streptomyces sp. ODS28]|uniref:salicylate synthase n=1 Tax=Streptomyces sp. ODS28 TaxID=3136688 RepID=UPI0031E682EA
MKEQYGTVTLETGLAPLDIAVGLASAEIFDTSVAYETPQEWSIAGGVAAEVVVDADSIRCTRSGVTRVEPWFGEPLTAVQRFLAELPVEGWTAYGWCAFELAHALTGIGVDPGTLMHLVVPRTELTVSGSRVTVRSLDEEALTAVREALARIDAGRAGAGARPEEEARAAVPVDLEAGAEAYVRGVGSLVEEIRAGTLHKAILSRAIPVGTAVDFPASYRKGRVSNTPARSFLLDMGGLRSFGFSPETVVEVTADRRVASQPLAGSRARTGDPETDRKLREDLLSDPKELHEHAISVKLAVDELTGPCKPESVVVEEYMSVKERGSVQHLGSRVVGRMPEGASPWDAFAAVFPAVTASGIPKHAAYQAIRRHEPDRRGPYAGVVMKVAESGAMDAALVLRSVYEQDGRTWLRAGAGVVEHSVPERELEETREKLRSVAASLLARAEGAGDAGADAGEAGAAVARSAVTGAAVTGASPAGPAARH